MKTRNVNTPISTSETIVLIVIFVNKHYDIFVKNMNIWRDIITNKHVLFISPHKQIETLFAVGNDNFSYLYVKEDNSFDRNFITCLDHVKNKQYKYLLPIADDDIVYHIDIIMELIQSRCNDQNITSPIIFGHSNYNYLDGKIFISECNHYCASFQYGDIPRFIGIAYPNIPDVVSSVYKYEGSFHAYVAYLYILCGICNGYKIIDRNDLFLYYNPENKSWGSDSNKNIYNGIIMLTRKLTNDRIFKFSNKEISKRYRWLIKGYTNKSVAKIMLGKITICTSAIQKMLGLNQ